MMSKSKSPRSRGLRVLYLLPLVCLGIGLQARTVYVPVDKDSEKIISDETNSLSGSVWKGEEGRLSFAESTFEIRQDSEVISGQYSLEGSRIRFTFTNFRNEATGKEKKGNDVLVGTLDGDTISILVDDEAIVFTRTARQPDSPTMVVLHVRADGSVECGGKVIPLKQIPDYIRSLNVPIPVTEVQIIADENVKMDHVDALKNELRKAEALKIRYSSPSGGADATRHMPPAPDNGKVKVTRVPSEVLPGVKRDNICMALLNNNDKIFFDDGAYDEDADILAHAKTFLVKHGADSHFMLRCDRGTSYGAYLHLQALIVQAYHEVREEKAKSLYGKGLTALSADELSEIYRLYPLSITEAEMKG